MSTPALALGAQTRGRRGAIAIACACLALLAGCAPVATRRDGHADRLADALTTMLPLGPAFDRFEQADPSWPLGLHAGDVSAAQLGCLRGELSSAGYRRMRVTQAAQYAADHPARVERDIALLDAGAAHLYGQLVQAGIDARLDGTAADGDAVMKAATADQLKSFAAFSRDPDFADLRRLSGFGNLLVDTGETASDGERFGFALVTRYVAQAQSTCHVPLPANV